ncbi:MAG: dTMP kinase [Nitrospirae bacterium]|nr:dTMP kinase [Nitrospirota bacterium]
MAIEPGRLIAVEGLDGSGKSTQMQLLKQWLDSMHVKVYFTEWNSSLLVKPATKKAKKQKLLTPTTFSLIHATDFADRYERQIAPLLRGGYVVLCDRFTFTAFARDGVRGCHPHWVRSVYRFAAPPDITFFFKLAPETAVSRILEGRAKLKYHEAGMDLNLSPVPEESFRIFQSRIHDAYVSMEKEFGFVVIDATQPVEKQQQQMRQIVQKRIALDRYRWKVPPRAVGRLAA